LQIRLPQERKKYRGMHDGEACMFLPLTM